MGIKITGTGMYVPDLIVTNDDLAQLVDTSDEWITKRTGIRQRRIANGELAYQMGAKAARMAMNEANITIDDIDLILATTISPDCFTPSLACLIGSELDNKNAAAMDINGACTGFVYAVDIARNFLETGCYKNILIVSSEQLSRLVDFKDRSTCILFGDGAGAVVVQKSESVYASCLGGNPSKAAKLFAKVSYPVNPWNKTTAAYEDSRMNQDPYGIIAMDGEEIFKYAATVLPQAVSEVLTRANLSIEDLNMLIPHQANVRILQAANKKLKLPEERLYVGIESYGNISSACIPVGLHQLKKSGRLHSGDNICITGFGAGLTYGAVVFEW